MIANHPEVGKSKPTVFNLPGENHVYGKVPVKDKEGAY